jgi:hypothetical protein
VVAVLAEFERSVEGVLDLGEDLVDHGEAGVGGLHLAGDALLFVFEQVGWDGVSVVELEELAAFVVELGEHATAYQHVTVALGGPPFGGPRLVAEVRGTCLVEQAIGSEVSGHAGQAAQREERKAVRGA